MQTIICNITNLDATTGRGQQNIVRTILAQTLVSVVRGVVRSVRLSLALRMRLATGAMAKPAYAMLPSIAARFAVCEPTGSQHCKPWQAGFLSRLDSRLGRFDRG